MHAKSAICPVTSSLPASWPTTPAPGGGTGLACTVLAKKELRKGRLWRIAGGRRRQRQRAALDRVGVFRRPEYRPPVALVGKAITFDSGGISIKPSDKMDEMKFDKCGGVAVLAIMKAIARLKLPLNVIGVISSAENMPSATSYRPGDIVTSYRGADKRGVTIEVLNTDAEGRIVLGDALAYARERGATDDHRLRDAHGRLRGRSRQLSPPASWATTTHLQEKIRASADRTGDRVWPLPLWQEYRDKIKSDVADIKNTGGRYGGAITAAAFLEKYVGDTSWAHLDIAGTAWTTEELPVSDQGRDRIRRAASDRPAEPVELMVGPTCGLSRRRQRESPRRRRSAQKIRRPERFP